MSEETIVNETFVNECVIGFKRFDKDGTVLFKNRDRNYVPRVMLSHTIIDGVEVLYYQDQDTLWAEGINEFGICLVNSALAVNADEAAKKLAKKGDPVVSKDGKKILRVLASKNIKQALKRAKKYNAQDEPDIYGHSIQGHTILTDGVEVYKIESTSKHGTEHIHVDDETKFMIYSNHGDIFTDAGYQEGPSRKSSEFRKQLAEEAVSANRSKHRLLEAMSKKHEVAKEMNPMRYDAKTGDLFTTSQALFDPKGLRLTFRYNDTICVFEGVRVNLPKGYKPKLKLSIVTLR